MERDKLLGVPRLISARRGFLSGPNSAGKGLSAAQLSALPANDSHRVVKAFVNEYAALFGHDAQALDSARVKRDSVTPQSLRVFGRWSGPAAGDVRFEDGDRVLVFVPQAPFSAGESVAVTLSRSVAASDGRGLRDAGFAFAFWTRAEPATLRFEEADRFSTRPLPRVGSRGSRSSLLAVRRSNSRQFLSARIHASTRSCPRARLRPPHQTGRRTCADEAPAEREPRRWETATRAVRAKRPSRGSARTATQAAESAAAAQAQR